jgi:hypothetical protein
MDVYSEKNHTKHVNTLLAKKKKKENQTSNIKADGIFEISGSHSGEYEN